MRVRIVVNFRGCLLVHTLNSLAKLDKFKGKIHNQPETGLGLPLAFCSSYILRVYSPTARRDKIHIHVPEQRSSYKDIGRGGEKSTKKGGLG